ncbi:MAG: 3-dehydroquinate synthase [Xanthomonadales bacterium]|nr:3-dehydroquinate synthase [Xanthomonadales bacterium]
MKLQIPVDTAGGRYPVAIGPGLLSDPASWQGLLPGRQVLVVSDDTVIDLYGERLNQVLATLPGADDRQLGRLVLPAGEASKSLASCADIFQALAALGARRDALIIALGGGVVGDLAGFAAACWMRGIAFVQVPTTLLAMVDSSVGGKTGINLAQGKNLVGAFHQPAAVIADTDTLASLPERELRAGLAEVVKYAAIADADFFAWMEAHAPALLARDPAALAQAIATSVRHKAAIVARDEREAGERALLNFGHTFGHAIETATGYGRYLHGEAVAIGMLQAARLSQKLALAPAEDGRRLERLLASLGLPTRAEPVLAPETILQHMRLDKKATAAGLRLVLWRGIGQALVSQAADDADLRAVLAG